MPLLLKRVLLLLISLVLSTMLFAVSITGTVTDEKGTPIPYSFVTVKGTSISAIANSQGIYLLIVSAGEYTVVCQHVGYKTEVRAVTVGTDITNVAFQLLPKTLLLSKVVIKKGEDDSADKWERDSMYTQSTIDLLRKARKPVKLQQFVRGGVRRNFSSITSWQTSLIEPLLQGLRFNSVEGVVLSARKTFGILPRSKKVSYELGLNTRYGFSNSHLNSYGTFTIRPNTEVYRSRLLLFSGGKRVLQFNRNNPIDEFTNAISTLFYRRNFMKIYEAWFGRAEYLNTFENGLKLAVAANYEKRIPLRNKSDFSFLYNDRDLLPNHPNELTSIPFTPHAATVVSVVLSYQPGQRYIELPDRKIAIGSKYPTLEWQYTKGVPRLFNSTANFDKWKFTVRDDVRSKMLGALRYRAEVGGFFNNRQVDLPDFQHFNGNQTLVSLDYLHTFQLASYYRYSNTEPFYTVLHAEHHFNGLLTNKIPVIKNLKWNLVVGTNTFYVNRHNYYIETFAGLENIFKIFRVDFIAATQAEPGNNFSVRIGLGGVIGSGISLKR